MLRSSPKQVNLSHSGIYVFESRHGPDFSMEMGNWDFDKICFVRQGSGRLISPEFDRALSEDDILYIPASAPHRFSDDHGAPLTLVMVCYYRHMLQAFPAVTTALQGFQSSVPEFTVLDLAKTHRRTAVLAGLRRMVFEQTSARPGFETILWGILCQLIVMMTRTAEEYENRRHLTKGEQLFAQSLDFLEERYTDPLQIKDLAAIAELSYRRYTTLFKESKGETVNAYINRLRIDFAKKRLMETGNVLYSALEAGFGDLSHFYRVFKNATGKTPKQFVAENADLTKEGD